MAQELKQLRVKIFDELSAIVDPEINVSITELELIDEVELLVRLSQSERLYLEDVRGLERDP